MRFIPIVIFVALFAVLAYGLSHSDMVLTPEDSQLVGKAMPELEVIPLDGHASLEQNAPKGTVRIINIFASWCLPCSAELPDLEPLTHIKGVTLIGIAWHDTPKKLRPWLKKYNAPFDQVFRDMDNQTGVKLGIRGVPETFIIDADGIIRYHHTGPVDAYTRDTEITPLIRELTS